MGVAKFEICKKEYYAKVEHKFWTDFVNEYNKFRGKCAEITHDFETGRVHEQFPDHMKRRYDRKYKEAQKAKWYEENARNVEEGELDASMY